ncbi:MAG: hypothetical protein ACTSYB_17425, partial [Candidatus Helarchaeota archaeon]
MIRAAQKNGVKFKVFENFRFHPPYVRAMELIKGGVIGDVYVVNYRMWSSISPLSSWKVHSKFLKIQGSKGIIYINGCTGNMFVGCDRGGPGTPGVYWIDSKGNWHSDCNLKTNWKWSFINSTQYFINAIRNDTE